MPRWSIGVCLLREDLDERKREIAGRVFLIERTKREGERKREREREFAKQLNKKRRQLIIFQEF